MEGKKKGRKEGRKEAVERNVVHSGLFDTKKIRKEDLKKNTAHFYAPTSLL